MSAEKIASYLRGHMQGEVLTSDAALDFFSTDASILAVRPQMIAYPRTTNDIRKAARFAWQLAEKDHPLPITVRGSGTDLAGAAIGPGMIIVTPAHLHRILEIDTKHRRVRLQPGVNFKALQDTLRSHGLFLPPFPSSYAYSTVGGAIANNTAGEKSIKYGTMRDWVERLEVVLANGEVIQTGRLSRREVERKKGMPSLEGEIYRAVDAAASDHASDIADYTNKMNVTKNSVGYALDDVRHRDGSVDLTPLFVGSQGTLGIVSEAILRLAPYTPQSELVVAGFGSLADAAAAVEQARALEPSAIEMVDRHLLEFVHTHHAIDPLRDLVDEGTPPPEIMLFIEFDDASDSRRQQKAKRLSKALNAQATMVIRASDMPTQDRLWAIRHSAAAVLAADVGGKSAIPLIDDSIVPVSQLEAFVKAIYDIFEQYHLDVAVWGHAGDANLHIQPMIDLRKVTDRQKVFKLMDEYYRLVIGMGGSIAAEHNDGRLRAPYVALQCGEGLLKAFQAIKAACDPQDILNPGVKLGTQLKDLASMLRESYDLTHLADHLPRT